MSTAHEHGFSLIEAVLAVSLLAVGVSAVAQLAIVSGQASVAAQKSDAAQRAARERLEQLRALAFSTDDGVVAVTDVSSDLSTTPPGQSGGSGLTPWAGDTLLSNVSGYCDFLDVNGRWIAGGTAVPTGAAWVRRWSVQALSGLTDTLLLQVVVVPARIVGDAPTVAAARGASGAWLVDIRTRKAR